MNHPHPGPLPEGEGAKEGPVSHFGAGHLFREQMNHAFE